MYIIYVEKEYIILAKLNINRKETTLKKLVKM